MLLAATITARAEPTFFLARVAPILDEHCVGCHGEEKHKAGLRLDSFEALLHGGDDGVVVKPGDLKGSEIFRRITLPFDDEDRMPSDGKPPLASDEIKILERWIADGASATRTLGEFPGVALPSRLRPPPPPLAPEWKPRAAQIAQLEKSLGVRLVPCSAVPTDGLVLRTASAPARCDDAALGRLAPVADLIVDAELARTKVTDAGLKALAACKNLRRLDLSHTVVTSAGIGSLRGLAQLESLNLTATAVDDGGVAILRGMPALKRLWLFGTAAMGADGGTTSDVKTAVAIPGVGR